VSDNLLPSWHWRWELDRGEHLVGTACLALALDYRERCSWAWSGWAGWGEQGG
jgi:hypothetical protein